MASNDVDLWVQFFKDAGVPPKVAVKYALTFAENRIKKDMLLDLNKEYLKEMGITLMGDIISILKHARDVYEEDARSNVLKSMPQVAPGSPATPKSAVSVSATRMLEHCIPREPPKAAPAAKPFNKVERSTAVAKRVISKTVIKTKPQVVQKRAELEEEEPVKKKVRRVLPEHEGKYKVIMPSGTTPRTHKILSSMVCATSTSTALGKKTSVFDRLGDSTVSSTTSVSSTEQPRITITGVSGQGSSMMRPATAASLADKQLSSSVFSRLGISSNTTTEEEGLKLQYAGILKKYAPAPAPTKKKIIKIVKKNKVATLKADMQQSMQLQERLGMSALPTPPTVAKVLPIRKKISLESSNKMATVKPMYSSLSGVRSGVKVRLGSSVVTTSTHQVVRINRSPVSSSSTSFSRTLKSGNVFARLGR